MKKFTDYKFKSYIQKALQEINFFEPTPIQELTIERALKKESFANFLLI